MKDWECIVSFLGLNISYDLTSGILAMDVKSKNEKLFEDHSILVILKMFKLRLRSQRTILTSLTVSRRSGTQSITISVISMRLLMVLAFTWQSQSDLRLLSPLAKLAEVCINLLLPMWLP